MASLLPLVTVAGDRYSIDERAAAWLSGFDELAVAACAGRYRTGKSYLLNRLGNFPAGRGFGVGDTVQACTRGIWLSTETLRGRDGRPIVLLDTEGIDALDAESDHDVRIFALAILLSSAFVYNSTSHLDEAALQTLSLMTRVSEALGDAADGRLYWVLRDFSLQLVDEDGQKISHAEYLERALAQAGASKCATREAIRSVFPNRHLVTLPRPGRGESAQNLEAKGAAGVNAKFERHLETFRAHLREHISPVRAAGVSLTGRAYVEYARALVARLNEGALPRIEDAWSLIARTQHAEGERTALAQLEAELAARETQPDDAWRAWARARAHALVHEPRRFVPPAPDLAAVEARLAQAAVEAARARGLVLDAAAIARERAAARCALYEASRFEDAAALAGAREDDPPSKVPREAVDGATLQLLVQDGLLERARGQAASEAAERLRLELEEARRALAEAAAREEELRRARRRAPCEEAGVQTDETEEGGEPAGSPPPSSDEEMRRAEEAEARASALEARALETRRAFDEAMEAMRAETVRRLEEGRAARDEAAAEAAACRERVAVLQAEGDKARALLRAAQEAQVEMHRQTLEDLRRRETDARASADAQRAAHEEALGRGEAAAAEARALKRRVDELLPDAQEAKRLRVEREMLREQCASAREAAEGLRRANLALENRAAVLEAAAKLDECRRAIG